MSPKKVVPNNVSSVDSLEYWKQKAIELESKLNQEDDDKDIYISPDKNIKVMSLCSHILNLTCGSGRDAKKRVFNSFGQVKQIPYSILVEMIEEHPTFAEDGVYYILDKEVVKKNGLEEAYGKILKREDIDKIFSGDTETSLMLYKNVNARQREMINEMLIQKIKNEDISDLTFISAIERIGGINLMEKVDSLKQSEKISQ